MHKKLRQKDDATKIALATLTPYVARFPPFISRGKVTHGDGFLYWPIPGFCSLVDKEATGRLTADKQNG